ncbi:uncharacterized protein LOC142818437 [Pelodiscus sinensis]|uniref:uncharacterized protein LOC142818437 n=1 Tax=Pelodiscus sinensis TaxID=13735 RepID=UPI003F6C5F8C
MDAAQLLDWLTEQQRQNHQQQTQLIQQLATQQQEQQRQLIQELADQHQAQQDRWFQRWASKDPVGMAAIAGGSGEEADLAQLPVRLAKMGPGDDPEALITFERVATAARWPEEHWATLVAPYLTGAAQAVYRSLPDREALNYYKVKEAILDQTGINPETYRQRFRTEAFPPGARPRAVAQKLRDLGWRWLEPEKRSGTHVAETIVLEQFIQILPAGAQRWVRRHRREALADAVSLMEDYLAAEIPGEKETWGRQARGRTEREARTPQPQSRGERRPASPSRNIPVRRTSLGRGVNPRLGGGEGRRVESTEGSNKPATPPPNVCFECSQEGHFRRDCPFIVLTEGPQEGPPLPSRITTEIVVNGEEVMALVDSGCSQTLLRAELVSNPRGFGPPVQMHCIHGDVWTYPTIWVNVRRPDGSSQCRVALVLKLVYPTILGRDWPGFRQLLQEWSQLEPQDRREEQEEVSDELGARGEEAGDPVLETGNWEDGDFLQEQRNDPTLSRAWEQARVVTGEEDPKSETPRGPYFEVRNDRLYRVVKEPREERWCRQLVVPSRYRRQVLELAYANPWVGHLGQEKTEQRIIQWFFWPGIYREIRNFCESCPECQRANLKLGPKAPLVPLPIVGVPFERIGLDLVGPLEKSKAGSQYIMVVVDYATRYPEAVPLRNTLAPTLATELIKIFSRVGIPQEILTDQGTNVTSKLREELCKLLEVKTLRTAIYHPQTDGLVERFNQTLKAMLRRFVIEEPREWDRLLPPLLFAICQVPQASTGFSPFELLYGRQPRGILNLLKETWEEQESRARGSVLYIIHLREKLRQLGEFAKANLWEAQVRQTQYYDQRARFWEFNPGDRVLLLLPIRESKLLARWQGPYEVVRRIGPVDYELKMKGGRRETKVYHVNLLKKWHPREAMFIMPPSPQVELGPCLEGTKEADEVTVGENLSQRQKMEVQQLVQKFALILSTLPGRTTLTSHHIVTKPGQKVRDAIRPLPRKMWAPVQQELQNMLRLGVVEESKSEWRSPIVLVPKLGGGRSLLHRFSEDQRD